MRDMNFTQSNTIYAPSHITIIVIKCICIGTYMLNVVADDDDDDTNKKEIFFIRAGIPTCIHFIPLMDI